MEKKYFGTDGVRGRFGSEKMNPEFVMRLAMAAGTVLVKKHAESAPMVLIGKDTRVSGYCLEAALQAGFTAVGVHVRLTGPLPTPGVAYLTRAFRLCQGVVISASHNPYHDNGIKFFSEGGKKLSDEMELEIEKVLDDPSQMRVVESDKMGRAKRIEGSQDRYVEFCKSAFPNDKSLRGLRIVVDAANGAAYSVANKVFHELGATVIPIADKPNGFNINLGVGATHPEHMAAEVVRHGADFGVALDGDADRVIMADSKGTIYDGDDLLYVIGRAKKLKGELKGAVVGTIIANAGIEEGFKKIGVDFLRVKVGDRYISREMEDNEHTLGGEKSGHIIIKDRHNTGDGLIGALQTLAALDYLDSDLRSVTSMWTRFPETSINLPIVEGWKEKMTPVYERIKAELESKGEGLVVLRPSGTEPLVRIMVQARDKDLAERYAREIAAAID